MSSRAAVILAVLIIAVMPGLKADSDLAWRFGPDFLVFDRLLPEGRTLYVVPLALDGALRISSEVRMGPGQPHQWLVRDRDVIVRSWTAVEIYRVSQDFAIRLLRRFEFETRRPSTGGSVDIDVRGSELGLAGYRRHFAVDLRGAPDRWQLREVRDPPEYGALPSLRGHRIEDVVFRIEDVSLPRPDGLLWHRSLTRSRRGREEESFGLGSWRETGH